MTDNIRFEYVQHKDCASAYVNGCYGGRTPRGEIAISFFKEEPTIPSSKTYRLGTDGQLDERVSAESDDSMIRNLECSVIMSDGSARKIYEWLEKVLNG